MSLENLFEMSNDVQALGSSAEDLENYVPTNNSDVNNASWGMEQFEFQGDTGRCGQYSQMFVIEEFTGMDLDIESFVDISESNGWFDDEIGTLPENMSKMLDYYGIPNEVSEGNDFDDLVNSLNNGDRVIVTLDADEIWYDEGFFGDLFDGGNDANHAVEVLGYDEETDCFILNDSGTESGCGELVPRKDFLDAWKDSNCYMIDCNKQEYLNQQALFNMSGYTGFEPTLEF